MGAGGRAWRRFRGCGEWRRVAEERSEEKLYFSYLIISNVKQSILKVRSKGEEQGGMGKARRGRHASCISARNNRAVTPALRPSLNSSPSSHLTLYARSYIVPLSILVGLKCTPS